MPSRRLPRFKRDPGVAPIQLTERDQNIIRLVFRHRFLRSSQIKALLENQSQHVLRRLQLLYHHGYLERPRAQIDYYHKGGSREIVCGLGNKGAILLKQEQSPGFRWSEKNRAIGRIYLEHAMLISDIMVSLELACRKNGTVRLLNEKELALPPGIAGQPQPFRWNVTISQNLRLGVIPDQVFALEYSSDGGTPKRAYFFLEADRGTMPVIRRNMAQTSFYRKLVAYEATWAQSIHETRFGFNRFRVLTVTKSEARADSLVDACSQIKTGHGLFLFTDEAAFKGQENLFTLLWKAGRPGETARLLD